MPDRSVILIAEDEEDYVVLLRRAYKQAKIPNPPHIVSDGEEAMA